jgi:GH43 family beta-xylosidase
MKKIDFITIETYQYDDEHYIDVVKNESENTYEAWVYITDLDTKMMMFGVDCDTTSHDEFLVMVEANAEEYIEGYDANYM